MVAVFLITFFALLLLAGMPIAGSILASAATIPLFMGADAPLTFLKMASDSVSGAVANNVGLTIVLFMISGEFMAKGKLTNRIFDTFAYFFGKKKGFMPIISILTCMFYGAISGSGPATTAAVGAMCYPMLIEMGYNKFFSGSILVTAGCLGMVIPPSVPLTAAAGLAGGLDLIVLYQLAAVGGVAAGLLMIIYAYMHCRITKDGDQAAIDRSVDKLRERSFGALLKDSIWALMTPVLILATIFSGIADTAQAAVLSLVYSMFVAICIYKTIRVSEVIPMIKKCMMSAAPLCFLIALSNVFSSAMTGLDIPAKLADAMISSGVSGGILILLILLCQLILGAFMDCGAAMMILVPLFAPVIIDMGRDPYTALVAIIMCQAVGLCSPLCGLCNFVMCPILGCSIGELGKHVIRVSPLIVLVAVILALCPALFSWATAGAFIPAL